MKKNRFNYDLRPFVEYLIFHQMTPSTAAIYEVRVKSILSGLGLESAREDYLSQPGRVSEDALRELLEQYSVSSRTQALCAWRAFVEYTALDLPRLDRRTPRGGRQPLAPVSALHPQAVAIWALFRPHPTLDPTLVAALKWRHLRWRGESTPSKAFGVDVLDEGTTYTWPPPLTALQALWDWARGRYEHPHSNQPLIVQECEGWEPASVDVLLAIHRAGRAGRIPRLLADTTITPLVKPQPPRPPTFGGGNDLDQKKRRKQ